MKTAGCLTAFALLMCGCAQVFTVTPESPERDLNQINARISAHRGVVATRDGEEIRADSIRITSLSTFIHDSSSGGRAALANEQIKKIVVRDAQRGRIHGLTNGMVAGALVGAGLGAFIGAMIPEPKYVYSDPPDSTGVWDYGGWDTHHHHHVLNGLAFGGATGLLMGGGLGLMIGSDYGCVYEIHFNFPLGHLPRR
ncbi:MAG: hypothetical protein NT025_04550 [bacterium]|nr:hypothetical protein [bacterium]